ncbi:MAG: response regulator [Spirochaetes bacterium]|nr:response regulator [Spirochaetota bacterium]
MNLYSFFSLLIFLISIYFAIESIKDNYKSSINKSYAVLLCIYAIWCLLVALMNSTYYKFYAILWYKLSVISAILCIPMYLIFIIYLTDFNFLRKYSGNTPILLLPSIIISYFVLANDFVFDVVKLPNTWFIVLDQQNIWTHIFYAHQFIYGLFALLLLIFSIKKNQSIRQKKMLETILTFSLITYLSGGYVITLLYFSVVTPLQNTIHFICFIIFIGIKIAITRFGLMRITPKIALKNILMNINDFIILLDQNGKIIEVNEELINILKVKKENIKANNIDLILNNKRTNIEEVINKIKINKTITTEVELINKFNEKIPINIYATILIDRYNEINGFLIVGHDIRQSQELELEKFERKITENSLFESALQYKTTIDAMSDFIHVIDKNYVITLCNKALIDFLEKIRKVKNPVIGENLFSVFPELEDNVLSEYKKVFETGEMIISEHEINFSNNILLTETRKIPVKEKNKVIKIVTIVRDITIEKKNEEHIIRSARLESLGILAGGIAHDFNNMLTGILGNINLAKNLIDKNNPIKNLLIDSEKATFRAKDLTFQLLTFSKGGEPIKKPGSIVELIKEASEFILRGSNIETSFNINENILFVEFDQGQMISVFHNIILNARESMINKKSGKIVITAENYESYENNFFNIPKGKYVKISISDNGPGIKKENLQKIFDPYFTTKEKGNGLGLAISFSIIKKHGGFIDVSSILNKGSTFYIYLPATSKIIKYNQISQTENIPLTYDILMMDDDEMIRKISKKLLTYLGCNVTFAVDGNEAILKYKKSLDNNNPFDLVILDLTVKGGMGGKETIVHLLKINNKINAIVCSGYSNDPVISDYKKYGFKGVINKPFDIEDLKKEILNVMEINN